MLSLNFSSALPDTVEDKNGAGTGFAEVLPNTDDNQYDPSLIEIDLTSGTLVLTATEGTIGPDNNLKNGLLVPIDGTKTFTVSSRLKGPFTDLTTDAQQGGIFLGSDQDNYVRLVITNSGSGNDDLGIKFLQEEDGDRSSVGGGDASQVTGLDWASINTLDLFLTGDPARGTLTAAYRINSDTTTPTVLSQVFKPSSTTPFFSNSTNTGILAFTKDAPDVPVTFDSFGIAQDVKINFQPPNSAIPTGYITDSGEAYDATRGFGWVTQASLASATYTPLSIASYARNRNRTNVDQRLDTLLQMQYPDTTAAAWEYALPNGTYSVTVSVGDGSGSGGVYDSNHILNVEGVNAINGFQSTSKQEYQLATVTVNVSDGKLTVDAIGGTNTKINYIEIVNVTPGLHPSVTGSAIESDATGVYRDTGVNVDVALPTVGAGVDQATLNTTNVQLYRTRDNALVPGAVNTSGGGDAIVYQPSVVLDANTNYTFRITNGVRDQFGATFIPYSTTFNTGTNAILPNDPQVNFTKSTVFTGAPISSLAISPDGKLYAADLNGNLGRWTIDSSGNLTNVEVLSPPQLAGRAIIGLAFDPNNANNLWITDNDSLLKQPADDFTGKITKLTLKSGYFDADVQDYVVGLPRSSKDHLSNSLAFGPDGKLYMTQGSNNSMGAPNAGWYNRPERLLTAAVLQIDPTLTPPTDGFNVQTENYVNSSSVTSTGDYNPFAADAPVKIFATGVRNAYDLVWHSNGHLYTPTNGSAAGGNTPDDPATSVNEGLTNVGTQNDYLFDVVQGGYYGHPNPTRQEYIMNGGNPTSGADSAEVLTDGKYAGYSVGTNPDPNYRGFAYDFGRNRSPNGVIEYKSNTFNGALKNKLLVVEYSAGDDILALAPGADGNIPRGNVTRVLSGFTDPVDLVEDTTNNRGNLYVAELIGEGTSGQISLLKPS